MIYFLISSFLLILTPLCGKTAPSEVELKTIYHSLDPNSISKLVAFYSLYPDSPTGKRARARASKLLSFHNDQTPRDLTALTLPTPDMAAIIALVNPTSLHNAKDSLTEENLTSIEKIAHHLDNRKLKGFYLTEKKDLAPLSSEEIDLARALLLYEFDGSEDKMKKVRAYEASLDLMALQILAYLDKNASDQEKIKAINRFIFHEEGFRFPPHSLWVNDVDLYTLLPSVLDSRRGVCLGVSVLYLSLAQRLNLKLEIITPPGHIYLRYRGEKEIINIETTARGISLPSKAYLGVNTHTLHERTLKEVIGLTFINQASTAWQREDHKRALSLYQDALIFLPSDRLLKVLLGYQYLFNGKLIEALNMLKQVAGVPLEDAVYPESAPEDFLKGRVDVEGLKAIFLHVDETRASIVAKQTHLKTTLKRYPTFRTGLFQLAITHLQLGQRQEGLKALELYHKLDPDNPTVEYYLAIISMETFAYTSAWDYLHRAESITALFNHAPRALRELSHHLRTLSPDPRTLP